MEMIPCSAKVTVEDSMHEGNIYIRFICTYHLHGIQGKLTFNINVHLYL